MSRELPLLHEEENLGQVADYSEFERELYAYFESAQEADQTELRVIRQFVEALLFERLIEYKNIARKNNAEHFLGVLDAEFSLIYDRQITFSLGKNTFACLAAIRAFDRVRIAEGSIKMLVDKCWKNFRIFDLLLSLDMTQEGKQRLLSELTQTIALCKWNAKYLRHHLSARRELGFQELESAIHEGHQYHPCFKTRSGFNYLDHQQYSPEAGNAFTFLWLAVSKQKVNIASPQSDQEFWARELGLTQYALLSRRLQTSGASWVDYSLVPVHPWQWQCILPLGFDAAIQQREIIYLGAAGDSYQATQSMRTLVNVSNPRKANIKVPLNIVCTSSRRNLQQHFVCTAPAISKWLKHLVDTDTFLQKKNHLILLAEYAAVLYEPKVKSLQGLLGCIFRESVLAKLSTEEKAVPFTALMLLEADSRPFIAEWIDTHGVQAWLNRLCEVMLIPVWHMLVHHGVALEAHAQNLILIHRNGWPEKIALRDFHENTEYVTDFLGKPEALPDFGKIDPHFLTIPDDDGYRMASVDELRELVMDTVFVFNLADLSFLLERFFDFKEDDFWAAVKTHLHDYAQSGVSDKRRLQRLAVDVPEIVVESLLKKKIKNAGVCEVFHHRVNNIFHEKSPSKTPEKNSENTNR